MGTLDKYQERMSDAAIKTRTDLDEQEQEFYQELVKQEARKIADKHGTSKFLNDVAIQLANTSANRKKDD